MFYKDLLNLIIDPRKYKSSCFLCFKQEDNAISIHENVEILDGYSNISLSLLDMTNDLFPGHEMFLDHACDSCQNLIIKIYVILRKNKLKKLILSKIIDKLNREVSRKHIKVGKNARITLKLPNHKDVILDNNIAKSKDVNTMINSQDMTARTDLRSEKSFLTGKSSKLLGKQKRLLHRFSSESIICETCGKLCKTSNGLRAHLNCHIVKQCPVCLKTLKSHSHFTLHVKQHEKTLRRQRNRIFYSCHDCDYKSLNKTTLEAHINNKHLHIRPFKCHICPKSFYKKSNLTQHEMIHDDVKKEMCHVCGENFVSSKTLSIHLKVHADEKSFECTICHKKFVTSGHRLEHFKRNHGEKSQSCHICGKKFALKKDLTRHFKKVHLCNGVEVPSYPLPKGS